MIEQLLMSRIFRRHVEAWAIVLMPWILFTEQKAVTMMEWEKSDCIPVEDCPDCAAYGVCSGCIEESGIDGPEFGKEGSMFTPDGDIRALTAMEIKRGGGEEIDYDYERDRLEDEFTLSPEEEQEMEERRAVWNEDNWQESPTNCRTGCLPHRKQQSTNGR